MINHNLTNSLHNYHQQYQNCYQALHQLAQMIDGAAQTMGDTDQNVARDFGPQQTTSSANQNVPQGFGRFPA